MRIEKSHIVLTICRIENKAVKFAYHFSERRFSGKSRPIRICRQTTQSCLYRGHQQGRGHAFSRNVSDRNAEAILVNRDEVVIITTHASRRLAKSRQVDCKV